MPHKKIAYCIHSTFNSGGMERILSLKANYLVQYYGYEVVIITTNQCNRPSFYDFDKRIRFVDLGIDYSPSSNTHFVCQLVRRINLLIQHKRKLFSVLYEITPDITISMFEREITFLPSIKDGSKKVLEFHYSRFVRKLRNPKGVFKIVSIFNDWRERRAIPRYDKFVVLTKEDEYLWGKYDNIICIPNPSVPFPDSKSSLDRKIVLAIGRLSYQKGFDRLILAWSIIAKQCPGWKLNIYGSGEQQQLLENLIKSLNCTDSISIFPPTPKIGEIYKNTSLLALSSHFEGFPMVILEGMSCGVPIVSFDCQCGPKDIIINDYNGKLIKNGDIEAFAESLKELINDDDKRKRMGENAYKTSQAYAIDVIMKAWDKLFNEICN